MVFIAALVVALLGPGQAYGSLCSRLPAIIDQRLAKDERLGVILTDLGTPKEVAAAILAQPGVRLRHKWTWQEILVVIFLLLFGIPLVIWLISFALTVFLAVLGVVVALMLLGWLIGQVMKKR